MRHQFADRDVLLAVLRKFGQVRGHGSLSRMRPSSTSFITEVVVAMHFVSDARSKIVSTVIGSRCRLERARSECLAIDDATIVTDQQHAAGNAVIRDRLLHDRIEEFAQLRRIRIAMDGDRLALSVCESKREDTNECRDDGKNGSDAGPGTRTPRGRISTPVIQHCTREPARAFVTSIRIPKYICCNE